MKITFLGTGTSQGVPVIGCECEVCTSLDYRDKRLRSSILVETEGVSMVVDTGPDFRQQMLTSRVKKLDAVLFTHEHKDHTAGLDDVRSFNFLQKKDMPIYGRPSVLEHIKTEFAYAFAEVKYPGVPRITTHEIENAPFEVEGVEILPIEGMHYKLPVYGFRIGDFAYLTDVNSIAEEEKEKLQGLDVFIVNALQKEPHISHFTLEEAIALAEEIKPGQTYFTHISHRLGLHKEVQEELPETISLAWDGLTLHL